MKHISTEEFFREVALRIHSNLDVAKAIKDTFNFMKDFIPMDMLGMYQATDHGDDGVKVFSVASYGSSSFMPTPAHPYEPIIWLTRAEANFMNKFENQFPEPVKYDNSGNFPSQLLKIFPSIEKFSLMKMEIGVATNLKCSLVIGKQGKNIFKPHHLELMQAVREPFSIAMSNALRYRELLQLKESLVDENQAMKIDLERVAGEQVVGADFGLRRVMEMVKTVARTASPVLLLGETGTGKELIAKSIHQNSPRKDGPFVRVQCGAMPEALLASELFGHEKGSYTGAVSMQKGRFERANNGTIFLDEIGELSPDAQVKLLRVLQEKEFERVGGQQTIRVDVRIIAATHRNLHEMVRNGSFREDLWFRLNVFPIEIPPLRERKADIPGLLQYFLLKKTRELNLSVKQELAPGTIENLMDYDWPGNVRELQNLVERALIIGDGKPLEIHSRPLENTKNISETASANLPPLDMVIKNHILVALNQTRGRIEGPGGAAELLGLNPSTLRGKLRKFHIPFGKSSCDKMRHT